MLSQEEQLALFIDAINKDALKMCREIEKDAGKLYVEQQQKLEKAAQKQMKERLALAQKQIAAEFNRKEAVKKTQLKTEFYKRREELTSEVFEKAKKRLSDFVNGGEYRDFLEKSIRKVSGYFDSRFTLFVKEGEAELALSAAQKVGADCEIKEDGQINIGGVRAQDEMKIIDDTLDLRLMQQREWFLSHTACELNI